MWRDFFYFSRAQRLGIIVLILLIAFILILNYSLPRFFPATEPDPITFTEEIKEFKKSLISRDSLKQMELERKEAERRALYDSRYKKKDTIPHYTLFSFNPNLADSLTFIKLGVNPRVTSNIIKYRSRGGKFEIADDLEKIYGLTEVKFQELKPYILIPDSSLPVEDILKEVLQEEVFFTELNNADTVQLMRIKGIGAYYAREIIKYRKELGGYVSVDQLLEIKNMKPENFDKIAPFFIIDTSYINPVKVNSASVDYMRRHPYINFYQARTIYELRKIKGKLTQLDELSRFEEFTEEDLKRLGPYLSFE